ncbi:hypothetical protein Tsubulata_003812, partial [Turnera subulata]
NLKGKRYIEKLELSWGNNDDEGHSRSLSEQILEQLQPSTHLKALEEGNCSELPALGRLERLEELEIEWFDSIVRVGPEFYGNASNKRAFPSLEKLAIRSCQEIRSFQFGRFNKLSSLELSRCPLFESLYCGDEEAPSLRKLLLQDLPALEGLPKHMHSLLPSLTEFIVIGCAKLRTVPEGGLPSSIEKLEILWCDGIESSPKGGFPSNLKELQITDCFKLVGDRKNWGLQALQSLSSLEIAGCEEVLESFPKETLLPPSLNTL